MWARLPEELVAAVRGRLIGPTERYIGRSGVSWRDLLTYAVALDDLFYRPWRQFLDAGTKRKRGAESGWTAAHRVRSVQDGVRLLLRGMPGRMVFVGMTGSPGGLPPRPECVLRADPRCRFYTDTIGTLSADDRVPRCILAIPYALEEPIGGYLVCAACPEPRSDGRPGHVYTITTRLKYQWVGGNIPGVGFRRVALDVCGPLPLTYDIGVPLPVRLTDYHEVLRCRPGDYFPLTESPAAHRCPRGKIFPPTRE